MAFDCVLLDRARNEILDAIDWYESRKKGLGGDFLAEVEIGLGRIVQNPQLFPKFDRINTSYRRAVLKRFPLIIIFSLYGDQVIVHSIFHTHQDPNKKPS